MDDVTRALEKAEEEVQRVINDMVSSGFVYYGLATWRDEHGRRQYGGHFVSADCLAQKHGVATATAQTVENAFCIAALRARGEGSDG